MAEVIAISALLWKAAEFLPQIRDGLYKGSAELDEFPIKVAILGAKHAQWTSLLQKFGMMEDEHLKPLVKAAVQILDKEQDYVTRLQKSRFMRLRRRVFPGKLTSILTSLADIVDASRQLLETRVQTNDLLVRSLGQTPCPLPFGPDRKYVPILGAITEVQKALEDADGPSVVILHGGPGMGKSSLVKYVALHYQQLQKQQIFSRAPTTLGFPDGVFYLLCERGAQARVNQLQVNLLESLAGGFGSSAQSNGRTGAPEEEEEFVHLPSHHTKLRFCLAERKSLIILDDVWEVDILQKLLAPGVRVKYLVTSQIRTICSDAIFIELKSPNEEEARKIMANYTEGLPNKGEFPQAIQSVTDAIMRELQYHPLSLANIGTSVNRSRATDLGEWKVVKDSLWESDEFDENDFCISPLVYGSRYPLTLSASMMLMVDCLHPEARHLLFLMGLLEALEIPEVMVKFFLKQIETTGWRKKYRRDIKYLEDRSLVEYRCHGGHDLVADKAHTSRPLLVTHGLRMYYIRNNHTVDVIGVATEIFSGGSGSNNNDNEQLIQSGTEESLSTILGAMYFKKSFRDAVDVASKLESQRRIFNGGIIPRSMKYDVDALDLMSRAIRLKRGLESLVWLLNPDGDGRWKQQAHAYAKKIVIRLTFRQELDDESMAGLIQLPHTTSAACEALGYIIRCYLYDALEDALVDRSITFSSAHGQTMKSLNNMCSLHDNVEAQNRCAAVVYVLRCVLLYESNDTILSMAKKWVEFLRKDSSRVLQTAVASAISDRSISRALILMGDFPGFSEHLLMLIVEGKDSYVRGGACEAICTLCESSTMVSKIVAIPGALEMLFKMFLSKDGEGSSTSDWWRRCCACRALCKLSCIPGNRIRFTVVPDGLEGLTNMLTSNPTPQCIDIETPVTILANLAMTNEVRNTIFASFPEFREGLRLLQISHFRNGFLTDRIYSIENFSRALTILDTLQASLEIPKSPLPPPEACYEAYMGRVGAYQEMQMYSKALEALSMSHEYYEQIPSEKKSELRERRYLSLRIFFKAMLEDYAGAMLDVNKAVENHQRNYSPVDLAEALHARGVLKRLARIDLAEALADLDEALKLIPRREYYWYKEVRYGCLKHRGLVKLMRGDEVGARADAESAFQLKFRWLFSERTSDALGPRMLIELPVNYLGFTL